MQSSKIYQHVQQSLQPFIDQGNIAFTVALSGGVDSVVLLHLMHALKNEQPALSLTAIYVNHGLSACANDWQQFCETLSAQLNIKFMAAEVNIKVQSRTSLEAQARDARYHALDTLSPAKSIILLGQHLNDQIETFLLRLKRGSGLKGLGAMHQSRVLNSGKRCFRPLLTIKRSEIEAFAAQFNITHITDDSNSDDRFDRNFLRSHVVPVLSERFKGFEHCTARSIALLQQQQQLLDEYTQADLRVCVNLQNALNIEKLVCFSHARIANILRYWLGMFTQIMPSQKQLAQIIQQATTAQGDAQMLITLNEGELRRHQGYLYFVQPQIQLKDKAIEGHSVILANGQQLHQIVGKGIRGPHKNEQVTVRFNCNSARIKPLNKPGSNTLKHWFKDAKVAPWLRANVPLIFYNEELVQVVGYFYSANHTDKSGFFWEFKNE
jgi:tRNA(Ile)-lysidine synthase